MTTSTSSGVSMKGRRWWSAVLLVALLLVGTRWFFRDHRPGLEAGQRYGLDVSRHQNEIDWQAVADDNIDFVYIKATEGGDWVDPNFVENWNGAKAAGLDVSAYHFFTVCRSGADQAANFLATVPIADADLPLALDLEFAAECRNPIEPDELWIDVVDFVETVENETGSEMLIYLMSDFDDVYQLSERLGRQRWERSLYHRPDDEWQVWQYSYTSYIDGIEGGVDLNVGANPTQ